MENSIIIKNLPAGVYVSELCGKFSSFGNILSATVQSDEGKQSSWEAYITFEDSFSAVTAAKSMNNYKLRNRSLHVSHSLENQRFRKVYVKNISTSWDECDLLRAFEHVGSIEDIIISEDKGKSNGYGYIIFSNHSDAKKAIERMNGKVIDGQKLIVERFRSKSERENMTMNSLQHIEEMLRRSVQRNNLHVKNIPEDMNEDQLRYLFEGFGKILSVKIATDEKGNSRKFGFVSFEKNEDAEKAKERMKRYHLKGKELQINFKEDGEIRKQYMKLKYMKLKEEEKEVKINQYKHRSQSLPKFLPHPLNYRSNFNI